MINESILIVDDNQGIRVSLQTLLIDEGYSVDTCEDGASAIDAAKARQYDIFIIDYRMPLMRGDELTRILRNKLSDAFIIGYSIECKDEVFRSAGANAFLTKDNLVQQIVSLIKNRAVSNSMDISKNNIKYRMPRYPISKPVPCSMGIISFDNLTMMDRVIAKPIDYSMTGLGVESHQCIEPSLIWFDTAIFGHRCGVSVWCRQNGERYSTGIQFIPLSQLQVDYFQQQVHCAQSHNQIQDPHRFIEKIILENTRNRDN